MSRLIAIILLLSFCGCESASLRTANQQKSKAEAAIQDLNDKHARELADKAAEVQKTKDDYDTALKSNFQSTANWTYGAYMANIHKMKPERLDNIVTDRLEVALKTAPSPTPDAIIEQNKTLKDEMDEIRINNDQLQARYDALLTTADQAKKSEDDKAKLVIQKQAEINTVNDSYNRDMVRANKNLNDINNQIIDTTNAKLGVQKEQERLKRVLIYIFVGLATLCAIVAALIKIRVVELGILAVCFAGAAAAIPFIQPWMVICGVAAIVVSCVGFIYYKFILEKTKADGSINAIQLVKQAHPDVYNTVIKPELQGWFQGSKTIDNSVNQTLKDTNAV